MSISQQEAALVALVHPEMAKKPVKRVPHEHKSNILNTVNLIEIKLCQLNGGQLMLPLVNKLKFQLFNHLFKTINLVKDHIILLFLFVFFFYASIL